MTYIVSQRQLKFIQEQFETSGQLHGCRWMVELELLSSERPGVRSSKPASRQHVELKYKKYVVCVPPGTP